MERNNLEERLRKVLEGRNIPSNSYSIEGFKDGASCLDRTQDGYIVYNAKKSRRNEREEFEVFGEAAYELISRIAMTKEEANEIQNEFFEEIMKACLEEALDARSHGYLRLCSLEGYVEYTICMEKEGTKYMVYEAGKRGNKYNITRHERMISAFFDIISRVSESEEEEENIRREWRKALVDKTQC